MRKSPRNRRAGLTLSELLVAMALFAVVSLVTLQLYLSAYTEFSHSSGTMTLNQRARTAIDKITQIVKTASPLLNANSDSFIHPNSAFDMTREMYEVDFISTVGFLPNPDFGNTWEITDPTCAGYVNDANDPRFIYETDTGFQAPVTRQPSLYRYRIAWNHDPVANVTNKGRNVPPRAIYFERLLFGRGGSGANDGALGWGEGPNSTANPTGYLLNPWIADTGTPIPGAAQTARVLARDVHFLTFTRITGNVLLLRIKMYNRDPITGRVIEGMTMRRPGFGGSGENIDPNNPAAGKRQRFFLVDLSTNIHLPNTI